MELNKKNQNQPILIFETHDHGQEAETNHVEGKSKNMMKQNS